MMRLVLALCVACTWLISGALKAQPAARGAAAPSARIVVQSSNTGWFEVAAWTPDSRFLFTANGSSRELLLWDIERMVIVDRLRLPGHPDELHNSTRYRAMRMAEDGKTLLLEGMGWTKNLHTVALTIQIDIDSRTATLAFTPDPELPREEAKARYIRDGPVEHSVRMSNAHPRYGNTEARGAVDPQVPILPDSPDGRWQIIRRWPQFMLRGREGENRNWLIDQHKTDIGHAATSPNGQLLAVSYTDTRVRTVVEIHDLLSGHLKRRLLLDPFSRFIGWADDQRLVATAYDPKPADVIQSKAARINLVNADTGALVGNLPRTCKPVMIPFGFLVGLPPEDCKTFIEAADYKARPMRFRNDRWESLPVPVSQATMDETLISDIKPSRRGEKLAMLMVDRSQNMTVPVFDPVSGTGVVMTFSPVVRGNPFEGGAVIGLSPDGSTLYLAVDGYGYEWKVKENSARILITGVQVPVALASNGRQWLVGGEDGQVALIEAGTSRPPLTVDFFTGIIAVGFLPDRPIMWAASPEGLRFWDTRTGAVLFTTFFLGDGFATVAPDGRYDTNLGSDSEIFRWLISDRPFQSLAPQTLMRDFYTPQMASKLLDCSVANNCAAVLPPLPALATLNRQLPVVRITNIKPADTPGQVVVRVEARETRDAQSGRPSGLFNVKLLLNNRQIDQQPPHFQQQASPTLAQWRELNQMEGVNAAGVWSSDFQVSVPTHHDGKPMEFSAYAFNSDRVKSDTARQRWTPPATSAPKRPRRAFVITIGVDDYVEPRLKLNFAVADARVIADRLAAIPGYEMRHISLTSAPAADGRPARQVTRADVLGVLSFLAGFPPEMKQMIRLEDVHKVRNLAETSPDDIVIISFSGHGFATASGQFALLPSTARWPATAAAPETRSVITAEDITIQLGFMKAAEIAFIIDACHSGAAVNTPDFKPGPMGDASLGQLSFDKGLRILAATQADDVALENAALKQGFLTAALGEGLTDTGGPADLNNDGRIVLDEWLRYAVARLPSLHEDLARGGGTMAARGVRLVMRTPTAKPRIQEPSLFDFNSAPSPVVLRGRATQ